MRRCSLVAPGPRTSTTRSGRTARLSDGLRRRHASDVDISAFLICRKELQLQAVACDLGPSATGVERNDEHFDAAFRTLRRRDFQTELDLHRAEPKAKLLVSTLIARLRQLAANHRDRGRQLEIRSCP